MNLVWMGIVVIGADLVKWRSVSQKLAIVLGFLRVTVILYQSHDVHPSGEELTGGTRILHGGLVRRSSLSQVSGLK
jgi:hypothetical protein